MYADEIDALLPLVYLGSVDRWFFFRQGERTIGLKLVASSTQETIDNFAEHFAHGVNFLITEISGGITAGHKPSPN